MSRRLLRDRCGSSAVEFALVLPALFILLFGVIDIGRYMWQWNSAEKAAQAGVRFAAVTDVVSTGLRTYGFVGTNSLTQGDVIPANTISPILCSYNGTAATCTCTASGSSICPTNYDVGDPAAYQKIVRRMQLIDPLIQASDVKIEYRGSGLGYAGDPDTTKPEISPLVTVNIAKIDFITLSTLTLLKTRITGISATMTAEDSSGSASN